MRLEIAPKVMVGRAAPVSWTWRKLALLVGLVPAMVFFEVGRAVEVGVGIAVAPSGWIEAMVAFPFIRNAIGVGVGERDDVNEAAGDAGRGVRQIFDDGAKLLRGDSAGGSEREKVCASENHVGGQRGRAAAPFEGEWERVTGNGDAEGDRLADGDGLRQRGQQHDGADEWDEIGGLARHRPDAVRDANGVLSSSFNCTSVTVRQEAVAPGMSTPLKRHW